LPQHIRKISGPQSIFDQLPKLPYRPPLMTLDREMQPSTAKQSIEAELDKEEIGSLLSVSSASEKAIKIDRKLA